MESSHRHVEPTHERLIRVDTQQPPVIAKITFCSPEDMTIERCVSLTATCCQLAKTAHAISLGQMPVRFLHNLINEPTAHKLLLMGRLAHDPALRRRAAYVKAVRTTVISPNSMETLVTLAIGDILHWYVIDLRQKRGNWICENLDVGCPSKPHVRRDPLD